MTRKLESLFNLPPANILGQPTTTQESVDNANAEIAENQAALIAADDAIDKIDAALPMVRDLDASDAEMDELALLAKESFENLMELSMNVEPRFSGPILQSASTLLGHAVTAKIAKMDKKLRMIGLQLKKAQLDQVANSDPASKIIDGKGMVIDRTELLKSILAEVPKLDK